MFTENQILDQTYQIIRAIGQGGAGIVYLAYHLRLQKYVVLKQISSHGMESISRTEVDALKGLHHPNLPQVYDFLQFEDYVFTVMDYIEGYDLEKYIESGVICTAEDLIHWFTQLSEVLVYIHSQTPAIIHGDIKPANIIITPGNDAVLIDFNVSITHSPDTVVGLSIDYASPEQISVMQSQKSGLYSGEFIDGRSDIYSLGATFYHLMTYRKPSVFYRTDPISQLDTVYPQVFCELIDKTMVLERDGRFEDSRAMLKAVNSLWRRSKKFKIYAALQGATIIFSALFVAVGAYLLISGIRLNMRNAFNSDYNNCIQLTIKGDYGDAIYSCSQLLNDYEDELKASPEKRCEIYLSMAECFYNENNYPSAADYYMYASEDASDDDKLLDCYIGAICSYIYSDKPGEAENVLSTASGKGLEGDNLTLLEIQLDSQNNNESSCLENADALLQQPVSTGIRARAALAAGQVCSNLSKKLNYYNTAYDSALQLTSYKREILRQIGYSILKWCSESGFNINDSSLKNSEVASITALLQIGADSYENIADERTVNDYFNLATVYQLWGKYEKALSTIDTLKNSKILDAPDKLLYLHKALIYYQEGDSTSARTFAVYAKNAGLEQEDCGSDSEWNQFTSILGQ